MKASAFTFIVFLLLVQALSCCADAPAKGTLKLCNKVQLAGNSFVGCSPQSAFVEARRLAELNDANSLFVLGRIYELGGDNFGLPEVKEDFSLAQKYYLDSARLGNVDAEEAIAFIYLKWYSSSHSAQGIYWQCLAASKGNEEAIINIKNYLVYQTIDRSVAEFCRQIVSRGEPTN